MSSSQNGGLAQKTFKTFHLPIIKAFLCKRNFIKGKAYKHEHNKATSVFLPKEAFKHMN